MNLLLISIAASLFLVLVLWFATQSDLPDSEGF